MLVVGKTVVYEKSLPKEVFQSLASTDSEESIRCAMKYHQARKSLQIDEFVRYVQFLKEKELERKYPLQGLHSDESPQIETVEQARALIDALKGVTSQYKKHIHSCWRHPDIYSIVGSFLHKKKKLTDSVLEWPDFVKVASAPDMGYETMMYLLKALFFRRPKIFSSLPYETAFFLVERLEHPEKHFSLYQYALIKAGVEVASWKPFRMKVTIKDGILSAKGHFRRTKVYKTDKGSFKVTAIKWRGVPTSESFLGCDDVVIYVDSPFSGEASMLA